MTLQYKIYENNQQKGWVNLMRHLCLHNLHTNWRCILESIENATLLCLMLMKENVIVLNVEKVLHLIWRLIFLKHIFYYVMHDIIQ